MTGMDVYAWLREQEGPLSDRVVFNSGGAYTPRAKAFFARVDCPKIQKPFSKAELMHALERVLAP